MKKNRLPAVENPSQHAWRPLDALLLAAPAAFAVRLVPGWTNDNLLFVLSGLAIIPLAAWMSRSTGQLAARLGPGPGALLNATFGNAPELIITLMALSKGLTGVAKASMIGSILGNILLVLGTAIVVGGTRWKHLRFNQTGTRVAATSLCLAALGMVIPTIFGLASGREKSGAEIPLSLAIAGVLFATYVLWLIFSLVTHRALFAGSGEDEPGTWPLGASVLVLAAATLLVAALSEFLAGSVEAACNGWGLSETFVGVIVVAIIGNAGEFATAVSAAARNKMDLSLGITIGSSQQIALFVLPVLLFASHLFGAPMTLEFSLPEITALVIAVGIVALISGDGECNWIEGAQLLSVYAIIATLFFFLPGK